MYYSTVRTSLLPPPLFCTGGVHVCEGFTPSCLPGCGGGPDSEVGGAAEAAEVGGEGDAVVVVAVVVVVAAAAAAAVVELGGGAAACTHVSWSVVMSRVSERLR